MGRDGVGVKAAAVSVNCETTVLAAEVRIAATSAVGSCPGVFEVRLSLPNRHHFVVDLSPFGLANDNEVFHADDRPYGLIEAQVRRDDSPDDAVAWRDVPGFC